VKEYREECWANSHEGSRYAITGSALGLSKDDQVVELMVQMKGGHEGWT